MASYFHPDLGVLRAKLTEQGFTETVQAHDDFTLVYSRHGDVVMIDLPEGEVYEKVEAHFDFNTGVSLLMLLGFPL